MSSYSVLRTSEETSEADSLEGNVPQVSKEKRSALGPWTVGICILCTLINLGTTIWSPPKLSASPSTPPLASITPNDVRLLRRPNQYIGLEKVTRPSPPEPKSFTNYPIVILPIDSANPRKVFDHDPKRHSSQVGVITPEERRVVVTDTVRSIMMLAFVTKTDSSSSCRLSSNFGPSILGWKAAS